MKNHYQTLGVQLTADANEIKLAFRKLALKLHPDKNNGAKIFEEKFREIREAYEVLINPIEKEKYDIKFRGSFFRKVVKPKTTKNTAKQGSPVRYSDDELEEFKKRLLMKLESADKELQYLQKLILKSESKELDPMLLRYLTFIDNLKKALERIENKTYGICRITGKLISKDRLYAMPHATVFSNDVLFKKNKH